MKQLRRTIKIFSDENTIEHRVLKTEPVSVDEPFEIRLYASVRNGAPFISATQNCDPKEFAEILAVWIIITARRFSLDPVEFTERLAKAILQILVKKGIEHEHE